MCMKGKTNRKKNLFLCVHEIKKITEIGENGMNTSKTEIYGTLGPACQGQEILEKMFRYGMSGMRLNLSHTSLRSCGGWLESMQNAAERAKVAPKLLIDLQGPELRIGNVEPCELPAGISVVLGEGGISVPQLIFQKLKSGQQILLDDGKILLEAEEVFAETEGVETKAYDLSGPAPEHRNGAGRKEGKGSARCRVLRGGFLTSRKSLALPGLSLSLPTLTESDYSNLAAAREFGVTGVMLPFVRSAQDLKNLRMALKEAGAGEIRIFAKIENMEGVDKLETFLPHADEIVIARGDLGNSMPLWELPKIQYRIGEICRKAGKPYMVVTQMLASMEHAAVPTRAEVSDIFYAILHGASSVMLTGETAAGEYPAEAMRYLCRTVETACDC